MGLGSKFCSLMKAAGHLFRCSCSVNTQGSEFTDITNWPTPGESTASSKDGKVRTIDKTRAVQFTIDVHFYMYSYLVCPCLFTRNVALLIPLMSCLFFLLKATVIKKENAENELSGDDENQKTTPKKKGSVV